MVINDGFVLSLHSGKQRFSGAVVNHRIFANRYDESATVYSFHYLFLVQRLHHLDVQQHVVRRDVLAQIHWVALPLLKVLLGSHGLERNRLVRTHLG